MAMLTLAGEIFLVVTPEVGAIRNSSQFLGLAREVGLGDVIKVIVNRANHGISLTDMSESLGMPIAATIVSNGPKAVIAANEGHPVIRKFPREKIAQDLHDVARLVTRPKVEVVKSSSRPWWMRLGTRASNA
jgi:pilus assembly protein CpaE